MRVLTGCVLASGKMAVYYRLGGKTKFLVSSEETKDFQISIVMVTTFVIYMSSIP